MPALSTEFVLTEEAAAIHGGSAEPDTATGLRLRRSGLKRGLGDEEPKSFEEAGECQYELYRRLNEHYSAALCLSGGGIRSAAFSLGVIEALARQQLGGDEKRDPDGNANGDCKPKDRPKPEHSLLAQFHYLSTVSGGGYIGSWLSAWCHHARFEWVWRNLAGQPRAPDLETATIGWLRAYSNYLTPKFGLLSVDFLAAFAIWLRDLLANWLVIIPVACIALLIIKLVAVFAIGVAHYPPNAWITGGFGLAGTVLLILALAQVTRDRPTRRPPHDPGIRQGTFVRSILLPSLFAAGLFIQLGASNSGIALIDHHSKLRVIGLAAVAGGVIYALGWVFARRGYDGRDFGYWTLSGVAFGALLGVGTYAYNLAPVEGFPLFNDLLLPVIFGVPWIVASQVIAEMIFVTLTTYERNSDSDREWLGRAAGWYLLVAVGWLVGTLLIFAGSLLAENLLPGIEKSLVSIAAISGAATAWIGGRGQHAKPDLPISTDTIRAIAALPYMAALGVLLSLGLDWLLFIAASVFLVTLIVLLSEGLDLLVFGGTALVISLSFPDTEIFTPVWWTIVVRLLAALAVVGVVAFFGSYFVNINRFSLHALYRNRLVRAFLGGSRPRRHPDDFTDFDVEDDPRVHELWPAKPANGQWPKPSRSDWRPFHVLNMTLNVLSSHHLSWQERKVEPFTVSPLHAGSACKAYRPSNEYGDRHGISLGTALAISGAAASPNMGYHSSPGVSLLLALFNVRLGWWLGNPGPEGEETYRDEGPKLAAVPLIEQTFSLDTDDRPYVYLSDGGHFENLGIYEMVRRRCRFIISVDASADPDWRFEDLGNALRKIRVGLGVPIRFYGLTKLKERPPAGQPDIGLDHPYHAIGVIDYAAADHGDSKPGYILYVKPAYHGVEGPEISSYAATNPTFPHQTTPDQWFSESQFESYRVLGFTIVDQLLTGTIAQLGTADASLEGIFLAIKRECGDGP